METGDKESTHAEAMKFPPEINSIIQIPIRKIPKMAHKYASAGETTGAVPANTLITNIVPAS